MTTGHGTRSGTLKLHYNLIRNLTSPDEKANGVQTWFANVDAQQILEIGAEDNLRTYIPEHSPGKRNSVHKQIANTIEELPDRFINRNSGITITCTSCDVDDAKRIAFLENASIINGAQTQGELRRYFDSVEENEASKFMVRVEIIMEPQREQIVEIAIARNTSTSVKSVSQAGARGYLTELKSSIEASLPGETIQMSETDTEGLNTQSILQWTRLLMPQKLPGNGVPRNFAYKQGGKCLADFSSWAEQRKSDAGAKTLYNFVVQMGSVAIKEYRYWERHEAWNGHRLHEYGKNSDKPTGGRPVRRDKATNKVSWVAPGIMFPIMSALSAFVRNRDGSWVLEKPTLFKEEELIRRAVQQFRALDREVAVMGRSEAAYDALSIYTDTIATVLAER
ncbi:AIPR family protein [Mesorhizobium sp. M0130]|uniref:AIPR family protein n=1 Tax=Mesorhizobium sp. M0130 TaxID=2956887 RepID=UPI003335AE69